MLHGVLPIYGDKKIYKNHIKSLHKSVSQNKQSKFPTIYIPAIKYCKLGTSTCPGDRDKALCYISMQKICQFVNIKNLKPKRLGITNECK